MFQELKAHLRYRLDDVFSRSSLSHFVLLVLLSLIVVLIGMTAYFFGLFSPQNNEVAGIETRIDRGFWDSLWWSLKHLIDPGFFEENYGATVPVAVISLLIAIMGMVIFGILIGFISTSMETRLAALQQGNSPVKESGHTLILGWSNKVVLILRLLVRSREGLRVVILGRPGVAQMQETLRAAGILGLPVKLILRSGSPSNILELKRVAFDQAASIIVLAGWTPDSDASGRDVEAIKTTMLLSSFSDWGGTRPVLVSEINRKQNADIARIAGGNEISVVSSSEVISKVIVQAARQKGLSHVYSEILSAGGNSIRVTHEPACVGKRFGDIQYGFRTAIPIGISWRQESNGVVRYAAGLNPEPDYTIDADDQLVLLSASARVPYDAGVEPYISAIAHAEKYHKPPLNRILVLGFNDNVHDILSEFDGHITPGSQVHVVSNFRDDEARQHLDRYATRSLRNVEIRFSRGDTVSAGFLRSLDVSSYDCVITLADESNDDDPDARSIMVLLLLSDILSTTPRAEPVHVVSEIHDPRDRELVARTAAQEIIVSPEIVSMQLSQISQQPVLESIYRELLSAGGNEICLKPASRYVELHRPCSFNDLQFSAQTMMETALGVRVPGLSGSGASGHGVRLNPGREERWQFGPEDSVVVLAQEIYD
ncbi:MAG: hypothetical protein WD795_09180 [Woeseia sp.]